MKRVALLVLVLVCFCGFLPIQAFAMSETFSLTIGDDIEVPINRFGKPGRDRVLWVPSEYGFESGRQTELAQGLAHKGFEVWQARLHEGYFQPVGRKSLTAMPIPDMAELISKAIPETGDRLFVLSSGRGSALLFMALREWLSQEGNHQQLAGVLLLHPNFMASTPEPGKRVDYLPVIRDIAVPTYIVQPMGSTKRWYLSELVELLSSSGSPVYTQLVPAVSDGYQGRPDATEDEIEAARRLPVVLSRAMRLLSLKPFEARLVRSYNENNSGWSIDSIKTTLQEYPGTPVAPALKLTTVSGDVVDLEAYRGRVVLVNFWATWCPPCVEEIPSLGRLQKKFSKDKLLVLSVDVGEPPARVKNFLRSVPAGYPVMMDPDGTTVPAWSLRAFPTTFVLDTKGRIRLSYFGGLDWDTPEVVNHLRTLVD
jgi:thiol-disulfide isomerase/thioredoxin